MINAKSIKYLITRYLYLIGLALLGMHYYSANAQKSNIDSLLQEIRSAHKPVSSVAIFNQQISEVFKSGLPNKKDSFILFIEHTIQLARELKDTYGLAKASYSLGKLYISADNGYAKATPFLLESLTLFEELRDSSGISRCYMQLGLISYIMQYYEDAIKNFNLSLRYTNNPTATYLMAISYSELHKFVESKKHFATAIQDFKENNNQSGLNECYMYLGKLYENENVLDTAFYYLNMAIENRKTLNDPDKLTRPYALISGYYLKTHDIEKAIFFAKSSYDNAKNSQDKISAIITAKNLSEAYKSTGDYKKAHSYLEIYNTLQSENIQGNTKQKIVEMQGKFDFNKKINDEKLRHQIELHRKNRTKNMFLAIGVIILLMAGGLWSRLQYVRKSKAIIEKEKEISENLLLNILPEEVATELKAKGYTDAKEFEKATILFTDFKGFTSMSEQMTASELVSEIDACFKGFDHIMEKYGIEKIKTIGDAYMAAGGLPVPDSATPANVISAGLEMQEFVANRKYKHDELDLPSFEMRVGIHTGPVIAGVVGVKKFQYDIWGDTVNTASRMESSGAVGKVNISQATYELLKVNPMFTFENRGKIEAKGKGEMEMWFVDTCMK